MVSASDKVDAVIVGAGAAGSYYAARLAAAGKSVVVLEAGPARDESHLISSQIWARRLKWGGPPVEFTGNHRGFSHNLNTGSGLGGAALHHYATWPRMHEDVFRVRTRFGRGLDWPFSSADLRPFYDRIQRECGISGDAAAEPWRPEGDDYPMPPLATFPQGDVLAAGFKALGLATAPLPLAINSTWYDDRPPCIYDGWCDAGCPINALAHPLATYLTQARRAGARVIADAQVTRLLIRDRDRLAGVAYVNERGVQVRQEAEMVILAASAIQNPRLMLASAGPQMPDGVGNRSGRVGRYFMLDLLAMVYGMMERDTEPHMGVSAGQYTHRALYSDDRRGKPFGSYQWQIAPAMKPNDIFGIAVTRADLFGAELHDFIHDATRRIAGMVAMVEQLPDADNRVTLSHRRDRFGAPLARVEHSFHDADMALWRFCLEEGARVMEAAGAIHHWHGPLNAGHLVGGTIMGRDPAASVVDGYGRSHEVRNLVLAGSGLFPTSGGVSPTFSLLAVAARSADHMLDHWGDYVA